MNDAKSVAHIKRHRWDNSNRGADLSAGRGERNRDMKYGEFPMITREEMTDISMLKDHILYSDEIEDMPKEEQEQVYRYCKLHATFRACQANLKQLRYAVTRIYFGW